MDPVLVLAIAVALVSALLLGWWLGSRSGTSLKVELEQARQEREAVRSESEGWRGKFNEAVVNLAAEAEKVKRLNTLESELSNERDQTRSLGQEVAAFRRGEEERQRAHEAQLASLTDLQARIEKNFGELAGKAVENAHDTFLTRANERFSNAGKESETKLNQLLQPVKDTLSRYEASLKDIESARTGAYEGLKAQIANIRDGQERVALEANRLRTALRSSSGSVGRWGEDQCENVLERAGLQEGIDFEKQVTSEEEGDQARPDFIVRLPGDRRLIIDVKCSIDSYLAASETDDPDLRNEFLKKHAEAIKLHARKLMQRNYQTKFKNSVDFVVMFVAGENFLHAAIQLDRQLLPWGQGKNLVIVGPTNLVALALTVSSLRGQERMNERAEEIAKIGRQLYANLSTVGRKSHAMGKTVRSMVSNWNDLAKTLDGNLLISARKFDELGIGKGSEDVRELGVIEDLVSLPERLLSDAGAEEVRSSTDEAAEAAE